MRVCLVSLDYKPFRSSGLTIYAEDLARGLVELGHQVMVVAARRPGLPARHMIDDIEIQRVPIGRLDWIDYSWRAAQHLKQLAVQDRCEVIHFLDVHFAYAYHGPFVASLWQSFRQRLTANGGRPYHAGTLDLFRREAYYRIARYGMEKPSLQRAARLIAGCRATRDEFVRHYQVAPDRIDLALQGIDTDLFRPAEAHGLRRRLGLGDAPVLLFAGFITPRKGLEYLAGALHLLPRNVQLVIMGRWAPKVRERFMQVIGLAADRVHEIGFVPDEERPLYYSLADVYVSPSLLEGLGITPIEALACGTPAVVTSASSGPEEVGDAGLIVPPRDPAALAAAIGQLLDDAELRRQLGRRGRERVVRLFSYRRMAACTQESYQRFLHNTTSNDHHARCAH
jgi:glycosyltransferase involved in cell wall biosynthesis